MHTRFDCQRLGGIGLAAVSLAHKRVAQKEVQDADFRKQIKQLTRELYRA